MFYINQPCGWTTQTAAILNLLTRCAISHVWQRAVYSWKGFLWKRFISILETCIWDYEKRNYDCKCLLHFNPYPTAFPYGNGMVLHFYQQQESSTTKTVHKVINKGLKTYV